MPITPNCRYGHGDLFKTTGGGKRPLWGLVCPSNKSIEFVGELYVCSTCGYTEFFDIEPQVTAQAESGK